ncbi:hypothetical protein B0A48_06551 [Cryoendolithus antarcticus]|uniref:Extradiol ring-cleavage dioxygenase class III enzyme subunit B domain-containing protein n=1 Tax=Cryoendolithus antarcticus TaxID=1507870 RepID=A0A1V8TBQ9_9PEZI|nr:hypothetical protein B0A48_06551 [Cryoendolithus antarcticus]
MAPSLSPVHFFSHGSTMMLGEESASADYWKKCGDEALAAGMKGVIMMGAHWDTKGDNRIEVATKPNPGKNPIAFSHPSTYENYQLNPDLPSAEKVISHLRENGIDAHGNDQFDWIHDTFLILIRMFPGGCPPTVLISQNARYDPHWHMRIGSILRKFRKEGYLVVGTGGAVHNLYRNDFDQMLKYRDNFAMPSPPDPEMLEFRQAFEDAVTRNSGPGLRRAVTRLMKRPDYRDAHGTDEHFIPAVFVAGAAGDDEDEGVAAVLGAEDWELRNMANSQFSWGSWQISAPAIAAA